MCDELEVLLAVLVSADSHHPVRLPFMVLAPVASPLPIEVAIPGWRVERDAAYPGRAPEQHVARPDRLRTWVRRGADDAVVQVREPLGQGGREPPGPGRVRPRLAVVRLHEVRGRAEDEQVRLRAVEHERAHGRRRRGQDGVVAESVEAEDVGPAAVVRRREPLSVGADGHSRDGDSFFLAIFVPFLRFFVLATSLLFDISLLILGPSPRRQRKSTHDARANSTQTVMCEPPQDAR